MSHTNLDVRWPENRAVARRSHGSISGIWTRASNAAINFAFEQIHSPNGVPLSVRLLNNCRNILMQGVRGANKQPGESRRSQNWIGGSRPGNAVYVPPPPQYVAELLGQLDRYMHAEDTLDPLLRIGLVHVQFETIHPYLDGNGRLGRMLIALLLEHWRLLKSPLLYLSLYLKQNQAAYADFHAGSA
ncbi:MAG: Fic family protein [Burkholderiaceae bacterium]